MTYTVERVHSCVAETRQAVFRLTYEVTYIPELNVWRHFLIKEEELSRVVLDVAIANIHAVVASDAGGTHTGASLRPLPWGGLLDHVVTVEIRASQATPLLQPHRIYLGARNKIRRILASVNPTAT